MLNVSISFLQTHLFWGDWGLTCTIAIFWTLAFESPMVTIEKMIFGRGQKLPKLQTNQDIVRKNDIEG